MRALVVGGGIGGLTAGIALRRAGFGVDLYERAPAIREVGAGLSLWPNALHVLDEIGVGARVRALGHAQGDGRLMTAEGRTLIEMSMSVIEEAGGAPVLMLHRASLIEALRTGFDGAVHLGHELTDVAQTGERVRATFANGATAEGDVLVGADGWRSAVRARVFPGARAEYVGYSGLRGVVARPASVTQTSESWGRGARFGLVPLVDGRLYWFACWNAPEGQVLSSAERHSRALETFRGWHAPIEDVIRSTDPAAILHDDVREIVDLPTWVHGRIALLGDAAHAMTPNLGQGGCSAIEDAYVLARCLANFPQVEDALDRYVRLRRPRVASIVRDSRAFGSFGQLENGLARRVRDAITVATKGRYGREVVLRYARTRPHELLEVTE
ncbi:MAG: FAD-dependent monooxygenase [Planctomycetota bacterium]|nr:FAD-dependent monooxygenase [Planctomycetota bacterium]